MKIVYASKEGMEKPADGHVIVNAFWCVHPEKGLAFADRTKLGAWDVDRVSPQCNRDRRVADVIQAKLYPDHTVEQIPQVFLGNLHREIGTQT